LSTSASRKAFDAETIFGLQSVGKLVAKFPDERANRALACSSVTPGFQARADGEVVPLIVCVRIELEWRPDFRVRSEFAKVERFADDADVWRLPASSIVFPTMSGCG